MGADQGAPPLLGAALLHTQEPALPAPCSLTVEQWTPEQPCATIGMATQPAKQAGSTALTAPLLWCGTACATAEEESTDLQRCYEQAVVLVNQGVKLGAGLVACRGGGGQRAGGLKAGLAWCSPAWCASRSQPLHLHSNIVSSLRLQQRGRRVCSGQRASWQATPPARQATQPACFRTGCGSAPNLGAAIRLNPPSNLGTSRGAPTTMSRGTG